LAEEALEVMLNGRSTRAHDAQVEFCNASNENVETIPGFVDIAAFDANEIVRANDSSANNPIRSIRVIIDDAVPLTGILHRK
jgi:hypothetical protein